MGTNAIRSPTPVIRRRCARPTTSCPTPTPGDGMRDGRRYVRRRCPAKGCTMGVGMSDTGARRRYALCTTTRLATCNTIDFDWLHRLQGLRPSHEESSVRLSFTQTTNRWLNYIPFSSTHRPRPDLVSASCNPFCVHPLP